MPDVNGHQILDYINTQNPETCVIVITGHATVDSAIEFLRKGACDYLRKPFEHEEFLKRAKNALHKKRLKSDRKRSEEALRVASAYNRSLIETSLDPLVTIAPGGKISDVNAATEKITGYSREELVGRDFSHYFTDPKKAREGYQKAFKEGTARDYALEICHRDGHVSPVLCNASVYRDDPGRVIGVFAAARDITEQKQAAERLRAARDELEERVKERTADLVTANEQLKREIEQRKRAEKQICRLSHELLMAQESERQRISRELHDVVGQDLSALKIGLDTFFDNQPEAPPETRQRLSEFSKILKGAIATVRDLSHTLRSTGLDHRWLVSTVRLYCEEFSDKNRVKVNFFATGIDESRLDFHTKINLYRMIQEGLNNVKKHADANHVTIRLMGSFPNIILRIEDDGKGFDVQDRLISAANERRMGLRVMEERAALLQGKMKIETYPKQGTKIVVEVPYKEKNIGRKENRLDC
jgi:PAS domain S-box-containing protein